MKLKTIARSASDSSRRAATELSPGSSPGFSLLKAEHRRCERFPGFFRHYVAPALSKHTPGFRLGLCSVAAPRLNMDAAFAATV